jgi:hypothetical protein
MNKFQYINQNLDRIKNDVRLGIVSTYCLCHFYAYSRYDYYRKQGYKKCQSVFFTSEDLKVSEQLVHRVRKDMEVEVESINNKL